MKSIVVRAAKTLSLSLLLTSMASAAGEKILVFCHDGLGGVHTQALSAGISMLQQFGTANGFSIDTTSNIAKFTGTNLANYAAIAFLDASDTARASANASQKAAFQSFIESGGGFIGIHCFERNFLDWPWYHQAIGLSHIYDAGYVDMTFRVLDTGSQLTRGVPRTFVSHQQLRVDSILFTTASSGFTVLVQGDSQSVKTSGYTGAYKQPFYPYVWTHAIQGGGRIWCGLMGHLPETFSTDTAFRKLILSGILYALNRAVLWPPAAPLLVSPKNVATGISTSPTLAWNTVESAATYGVQLSTTVTFATTVASLTGLTSPSATVSRLAAQKTYRWRANAANTAGSSAWSSTWSFTTASTGIVQPGTDEKGRVTIDRSLEIRNGELRYAIVRPCGVKITVTDIRGRSICLVNGYRGAGCHSIALSRRTTASGLYVVHFQTAYSEERMVVLIQPAEAAIAGQ